VTVLNGLKACQLSYGDWVAVPGAGGGLGHLAVQYAIATGMKVVGIDTGAEKRKLVEGYGGVFIDFKEEKVSGRGLIVSSELTRLTGYRCRRKESNGRQGAARSIDICCVRRGLHHGKLFVG
jgi:propanol-preferring alcohol dehydrogenase